jgi:hypothetical protein
MADKLLYHRYFPAKRFIDHRSSVNVYGVLTRSGLVFCLGVYSYHI